MAVLSFPMESWSSASKPKPEFREPLLKVVRTPLPSAVFALGRTPPKSDACTPGISANEVSTKEMRNGILICNLIDGFEDFMWVLGL